MDPVGSEQRRETVLDYIAAGREDRETTSTARGSKFTRTARGV